MGQPLLNGGYYYSPSGEGGLGLVSRSREESVAGTPYTYHNGLAMFTSESGQQQALGLALQHLPGKGGSQSSVQPLPLLYGGGGGGGATTAMFLPSVSQQQLQLQSHINVAAVQSQVVRPLHAP